MLLLRSGPDELPRSWALLIVTLFASMFLSVLVTRIIFPEVDPRPDVVLLISVITMLFYFVVLQISGYNARLLQCLTAIMGTDFVLTVLYMTGFLIMINVLDKRTALAVTLLLANWSVLVQGHLVARTIQRHWGIGIAIAFGLHIMLLLIYGRLIGDS